MVCGRAGLLMGSSMPSPGARVPTAVLRAKFSDAQAVLFRILELFSPLEGSQSILRAVGSVVLIEISSLL